MPQRLRRIVGSGALLLVLGAVVRDYRLPGGSDRLETPDQLPQPVSVAAPAASAADGRVFAKPGQLPKPTAAVAPTSTAAAAAAGGQIAASDDSVQPHLSDHTHMGLGSPASTPRPTTEAGSAPATTPKSQTPCSKQSSLHDTCRKCRSGSPGDGGVEAIGGLCREHCSRQGTGYCGIGDDYLHDGLDCRPCRRWLPGADATQSFAGVSGGRSNKNIARVGDAYEDGPTPLLLADDRIDAVCFDSASVADSHSLGDVGSCIGGNPCPTFTSLAVAQASCSRDSRCLAVALNGQDAAGPRFELRGGSTKLQVSSTLPEHDQIPDIVLWHVADSCEDDNQSETLGQAPLQMYLSVKTSAVNGNHARRPLSLLRSWANTRSVREQTFFFTDDAEQDPALLAMSGGESHWIDTQCGSARGRSLCCKTDAELRGFVAWANARNSGRRLRRLGGQPTKWWCHLDDDNYVLIKPLSQFLNGLQQPDVVPYYVGRAGPTLHGNRLHAPFAMGGAGYCLNEVAARLAAKELQHDIGDRSAGLRALCDEIDYPDDMALGVLMTQRLNPPVPLTEDPLATAHTGPHAWNGGFFGGRFHSQWEIYGHSLAELMMPLVRAQPQSGQQLTPSRRPHEQFVYGWDRKDKAKSSASRDMLHLHYYLRVLSQESAASVGAGHRYSSCYGEPQHGPVTADGALERKLGSNGLMLAFQYGSVVAAMVGCNTLGDACSVVAAVDIVGGDADSGCAYVLFGALPPGVETQGATGWKQGCGTAWTKLPMSGSCLEPKVFGNVA